MKDRPRTNRMSRHLYDIEKLSHTKYMSMALADHDLYMQIVRHRKKYYHLGYVDYDKILPDTIDFVPPVRVIDSFRSDYNEMTGSFIYEESSLASKDCRDKGVIQKTMMILRETSVRRAGVVEFFYVLVSNILQSAAFWH